MARININFSILIWRDSPFSRATLGHTLEWFITPPVQPGIAGQVVIMESINKRGSWNAEFFIILTFDMSMVTGSVINLPEVGTNQIV